MGFQYYPDSNMKYCVLLFMLACVVFIFYSITDIVNKQLIFQTNFGIGSETNLVDYKQIEATSKYGNRVGQKYEHFILKQAEVYYFFQGKK